MLEILITTEHRIISKTALFCNSPFRYCNEANTPDKTRPATSNRHRAEHPDTATAPTVAPHEDSLSVNALTGLPLAVTEHTDRSRRLRPAADQARLCPVTPSGPAAGSRARQRCAGSPPRGTCDRRTPRGAQHPAALRGPRAGSAPSAAAAASPPR